MWEQRSEKLINMRAQRYNSILEPVFPTLHPGQNVISFVNTNTNEKEFASLQSGGVVTHHGIASSFGEFLEKVRPLVKSIFDDVHIRERPLEVFISTSDTESNEHDYEIVLGHQYTRSVLTQMGAN